MPRSRRPGPRGADDALLDRALAEDRVEDDRTSRALLPARLAISADVVAQAPGVVSGIAVAAELARRRGLRVRVRVRDGARVRRGSRVLTLHGNARRLLGVERTLLNFLMHLSGVATATRRAVDAAGPLRVLATRKTLPGLRDVEKAAVVHGGGAPHRRDLAEAILVKSTHLDLAGAAGYAAVARHARAEPVIVEVRSLDEAILAIGAGSRHLLLDNLAPAAARRLIDGLARRGLRRGVTIELSGGISGGNLRAYRGTGADAASLGALTHSAPALPFHLVLARR